LATFPLLESERGAAGSPTVPSFIMEQQSLFTAEAFRQKRRRVYLLRHGDVSYFDANGRPFHPDTVPLNEEGRRQAQAAASVLADLPIDRAVSSDLLRSQETAQIVLADRTLRLETCAAFREVRPGRLADIADGELERAFLGGFAGDVDRASRFLAGETLGSLIDRVLACFQEFVADPCWRHLLIVAHGGVNRAILTHALGMDVRGFGFFEQDPACMNILDVDETGRWLIRLVNFTPYNPAKVGLDLTTMERLYLQYRRPGA
jgi:probable phosphoglycerate mutase